MSGKLQLFTHREDANLYTVLGFNIFFAWKDESRLREIGLLGQLLHFAVRDSASISKYRQHVACQWFFGEDVNQLVRESAHRIISAKQMLSAVKKSQGKLAEACASR